MQGGVGQGDFPEAQPNAPMSSLRILMVEDNPGDARLVHAMLAEGGQTYDVIQAETLAEALKRAAAEYFDVALLDLGLPDSLGLDTLRRVMAAEPTLPIVVLTGNADEAQALEAIEAGAQDYLIKGWGGSEALRRAIRYAIERGRTESRLRHSESLFRAVFENAALGISVMDRDCRIVTANHSCERMLGYDQARLKTLSISELTHPEDAGESVRLAEDLMAGGRDHYTIEKRFRKMDGNFIWGKQSMSLVRDQAGKPSMGVAMIEDIDERKRMEEMLRLDARVIATTSEGVFVTDAKRRIVHVNPAFVRITGFEASEAIGAKPSILSSGRHGADFYARMDATLASSGAWQGEIWNRRKSGEIYPVWLDISLVRNDRGEIANYVAVFSDISSRKQTEERLAWLAAHDPLTGLANRALYSERLDRALDRAARTALKVALVFLDLDAFKEVNDRHGHPIGDLLLQQLSERLNACMRQGDTVARRSGDEFVAVLEDLDDFHIASRTAGKMLDSLAQPFDLGDRLVKISGSIGIALFPDDALSADALFKAADAAMYRAKRQGGGRICFHAEALEGQAEEQTVLDHDFSQALEKKEFLLCYQPLHDMSSGRLVAVEALLRWQRPGKGLSLPGEFLAAASETGRICDIGRWVLETACKQAMIWIEAGHDIRLVVNLSETELTQPSLADDVAKALSQSGLPAERLELDLPETAVMEDEKRKGGAVKSLHALGVRLAIDNFGSGFSSLGQLQNLPIHVLKIEAAFVRDIASGDGDARAVSAVAALARTLKRQIVAKGVETEEQRNFLVRQGYEMAQGFLFGRPLPVEQCAILLKEARTS
jgi:diguanylate cyclase (GGDEF)-like protein/PAS domain S-box-containing protein